MRILFLIGISSTSGLDREIIVLDYVLNVSIELIKFRNDNPHEKFYLMHIIFEGRHLSKFGKS